MIVNKEPYPLSFEMQLSQAIVCRYGEEFRQYKLKPDINVSGLSCLLQIAKPDGTFTENDVEVVTEEDECYLILTIPKQATVVKGVAKYSVCCYGEVETETHLLYSAEGPLWVDDALITEEMIESVAEVNGYRFPQDFVTLDMIPNLVDTIIHAIINDDVTTDHSTWSSNKLSTEIDDIYDAISGLSVDIVYSLTEHKIGKWIDGKDLYEITLDITSPASVNTNATIESLASLSFDNIISLDGIIYAAGVNQYVPIFWSYNTAIMGAVYVDGTNLKQILTSSAYCNCREWITLRYTKQ